MDPSPPLSPVRGRAMPRSLSFCLSERQRHRDQGRERERERNRRTSNPTNKQTDKQTYGQKGGMMNLPPSSFPPPFAGEGGAGGTRCLSLIERNDDPNRKEEREGERERDRQTRDTDRWGDDGLPMPRSLAVSQIDRDIETKAERERETTGRTSSQRNTQTDKHT